MACCLWQWTQIQTIKQTEPDTKTPTMGPWGFGCGEHNLGKKKGEGTQAHANAWADGKFK